MRYEAIRVDADGILTERTPSEVRRAAARATFAEFDADPTPDIELFHDLRAVS